MCIGGESILEVTKIPERRQNELLAEFERRKKVSRNLVFNSYLFRVPFLGQFYYCSDRRCTGQGSFARLEGANM